LMARSNASQVVGHPARLCTNSAIAIGWANTSVYPRARLSGAQLRKPPAIVAARGVSTPRRTLSPKRTSALSVAAAVEPLTREANRTQNVLARSDAAGFRPERSAPTELKVHCADDAWLDVAPHVGVVACARGMRRSRGRLTSKVPLKATRKAKAEADRVAAADWVYDRGSLRKDAAIIMS